MPRRRTSHTAPELGDLAALEILKGVSLESVQDLLESCRVVELESGDMLIRAGELNAVMYLVLSGRLRVHLDSPGNDPVVFLDAGVTVGEMSVLDDGPASAFVIADTKSRLLAVDETTFWRLVSASHDFAINLLLLLAQRLRANNSAISDKVRLQREYQRRATMDALTGLYNRRWLNETLPRLIQRYSKSTTPFSLLLLDIDHFKHLNDTFGHVTGDHVLTVLSRRLNQNLRPTDLAARYGGEEFVVLLPDTDDEGARLAAERLRCNLEKADWKAPDGRAIGNVTVSIGGARLVPGQTMTELVERADGALYAAKNAGRNRVAF